MYAIHGGDMLKSELKQTHLKICYASWNMAGYAPPKNLTPWLPQVIIYHAARGKRYSALAHTRHRAL